MLQKTDEDLPGDAGDAALHAEAIVEPAVWIPDFPGDEPDVEYTSWRDLLFVYSEGPQASGPVAGSANGSANKAGEHSGT